MEEAVNRLIGRTVHGDDVFATDEVAEMLDRMKALKWIDENHQRTFAVVCPSCGETYRPDYREPFAHAEKCLAKKEAL